MIFLSTLGTGYFLGLFGPAITAEFDTDQTTIGMIFAISTLAAVVPMFYLGGLVDRISLRAYTVILFSIFSLASATIAAAPGLIVFAVGVLFVRLLGDWLFTHAALTASVRLLGSRRKRLAGLPAIGYALGPSLLPGLAVLLLAQLGWRQIWLLIALSVALVVIPLFLWLLAPEQRVHANVDGAREPAKRLVIDRRVLPFLPVLMCVPLIFSGVLFHQAVWLGERGNGAAWIGWGMGLYAVAQTSAMLMSGFLVERWTSVRVVGFHAVPAAIGMTIAALGPVEINILAYFLGGGFSTGLYFACTPHLLADLYGNERLGAARSAVQCVTLVCSAASTVAIGLWVDLGQGIEPIFIGGVAIVVATSAIALGAFSWYRPG